LSRERQIARWRLLRLLDEGLQGDRHAVVETEEQGAFCLSVTERIVRPVFAAVPDTNDIKMVGFDPVGFRSA
jgi:hypothetical protein